MIWRVVVHYTYIGLSFTCERGAKANDPGSAVNAVLLSVRADRADSWKAYIEPAFRADLFSEEALKLPLVNGRGETVGEAF